MTTQKGRSIVYMTSAVVVFPMGKYTCILSSIVFTIGLIIYVNRCRDIGPRDDESSLNFDDEGILKTKRELNCKTSMKKVVNRDRDRDREMVSVLHRKMGTVEV